MALKYRLHRRKVIERVRAAREKYRNTFDDASIHMEISVKDFDTLLGDMEGHEKVCCWLGHWLGGHKERGNN